MRIVIAFVPEIFLNSTLPSWFDRKCAERGYKVEWLNVNISMPRYKPAFNQVKNIITWQCRMPHSWTSSQSVNLLHIDNALLAQRHGCFVDARGFFSESNLCASHHANSNADYPCEVFAAKHFGWQAFQGGTQDGPILLALQHRRDCNVNFEFPGAPKTLDKVKFTIEVAKTYLSDRHVLVRPHPRERELFTDRETLPDGWEWSMDGSLADVLPKCSALVTVNSTCATEACLLGLPTYTLGTGTFTGSGAVRECADNFGLIQGAGYEPCSNEELAAQRQYVSTVLTHHTLPYNAPPHFENQQVDLWLERLQ